MHANQQLTTSAVNVMKAEASEDWKTESQFDASKDKSQFRQYEDACDRVKAFYREQHGEQNSPKLG